MLWIKYLSLAILWTALPNIKYRAPFMALTVKIVCKCFLEVSLECFLLFTMESYVVSDCWELRKHITCINYLFSCPLKCSSSRTQGPYVLAKKDSKEISLGFFLCFACVCFFFPKERSYYNLPQRELTLF